MTIPSAPAHADVCLVLMPYIPVERPAIGASILKSALAVEGIDATLVYANLYWAEEVDLYVYDALTKHVEYELAGEWTFSGSAFPTFEPDHERYFQQFQFRMRDLERALRQARPECAPRELLWQVRERAPAFIERMARHVLDARPRIVGCSSTLQQHCASLSLLRAIKRAAPDVVTVLGGTNCEASMGVVTHRQCPWIDFVVSGEADQLFPRLCRRILDAGPEIRRQDLPYGVIGPAHRAQGGLGYNTLMNSPPRETLADMNHSPTPDYDDYFRALGTCSFAPLVRPSLVVETSRGCWWGAVKHCTFCGINGGSMEYRSKEPARAVQELQTLARKYRIHNFAVSDSILDMDYIKTVLPALAGDDIDYNIWYETKANLKRDQVRLLAEAGIRWIQPGLESMDDVLLRSIDKGTTTHQNIQLLKWAQEFGIYVDWTILYNIPGESDERYLRMSEWLPLIAHLQPPNGLCSVQFHRFSPYHMRPDLFALSLEPSRAYRYVYPWAPQDMKDFAYFFDDYRSAREQINVLDRPEVERPGLRALQDVNIQWREQWMGQLYPNQGFPDPATLVMTDDGSTLTITDTRRCAVEPRSSLTGLSRLVYLACDRAQNRGGLDKLLETEHRVRHPAGIVDAALTDLCARKLLLELDAGRFLALAVPGPLRPVLDPTQHAIGGLIEPRVGRLMQMILSTNGPRGIDAGVFTFGAPPALSDDA